MSATSTSQRRASADMMTGRRPYWPAAVHSSDQGPQRSVTVPRCLSPPLVHRYINFTQDHDTADPDDGCADDDVLLNRERLEHGVRQRRTSYTSTYISPNISGRAPAASGLPRRHSFSACPTSLQQFGGIDQHQRPTLTRSWTTSTLQPTSLRDESEYERAERQRREQISRRLKDLRACAPPPAARRHTVAETPRPAAILPTIVPDRLRPVDYRTVTSQLRPRHSDNATSCLRHMGVGPLRANLSIDKMVVTKQEKIEAAERDQVDSVSTWRDVPDSSVWSRAHRDSWTEPKISGPGSSRRADAEELTLPITFNARQQRSLSDVQQHHQTQHDGGTSAHNGDVDDLQLHPVTAADNEQHSAGSARNEGDPGRQLKEGVDDQTVTSTPERIGSTEDSHDENCTSSAALVTDGQPDDRQQLEKVVDGQTSETKYDDTSESSDGDDYWYSTKTQCHVDSSSSSVNYDEPAAVPDSCGVVQRAVDTGHISTTECLDRVDATTASTSQSVGKVDQTSNDNRTGVDVIATASETDRTSQAAEHSFQHSSIHRQDEINGDGYDDDSDDSDYYNFHSYTDQHQKTAEIRCDDGEHNNHEVGQHTDLTTARSGAVQGYEKTVMSSSDRTGREDREKADEMREDQSAEEIQVINDKYTCSEQMADILYTGEVTSQTSWNDWTPADDTERAEELHSVISDDVVLDEVDQIPGVQTNTDDIELCCTETTDKQSGHETITSLSSSSDEATAAQNVEQVDEIQEDESVNELTVKPQRVSGDAAEVDTQMDSRVNEVRDVQQQDNSDSIVPCSGQSTETMNGDEGQEAAFTSQTSSYDASPAEDRQQAGDVKEEKSAEETEQADGLNKSDDYIQVCCQQTTDTLGSDKELREFVTSDSSTEAIDTSDDTERVDPALGDEHSVVNGDVVLEADAETLNDPCIDASRGVSVQNSHNIERCSQQSTESLDIDEGQNATAGSQNSPRNSTTDDEQQQVDTERQDVQDVEEIHRVHGQNNSDNIEQSTDSLNMDDEHTTSQRLSWVDRTTPTDQQDVDATVTQEDHSADERTEEVQSTRVGGGDVVEQDAGHLPVESVTAITAATHHPGDVTVDRQTAATISWETRCEELSFILRKNGVGLGFCISGGRDFRGRPHPIVVKRLFLGETWAKEYLQAGDELAFVNGVCLDDVSQQYAWDFLRGIPDGLVSMTIRRRHYVTTS